MGNVLIQGKRLSDRTVVEEVRTSDGGAVITIPYSEMVGMGLITGAQPFGGYGERTTSGAASGVIWSNGAYAFPASSGIQMSIVSTSANDSSAGTGIRTLDIHYLDDNLDEQIETVTLNGLTSVVTVATNIRFIQCMHGKTFGTGKAAAGNITAYVGSQNYSEIYAGYLRCSSSVRMVPRGHRLIVTSMFGGAVSGASGAKVIIRISTPTFDGHDFTSSSIFMPLFSAAFQDNSGGLTIPCPLTFTEGQSVGMTFETDKAATVVGSWFGWLEVV